MKTLLVMTVLAQDHPGLVDVLASTIAEHNGNWLESRMAHLGGQFAGILRVSVPRDEEPALTRGLTDLKQKGIAVAFHSDSVTRPPATAATATLELIGQDRPGIVQSICGALARGGVNVEEFESSCESAPMTGEHLFRAQARLQLPPECDIPKLHAELERIAADLMVDLQFKT
jgi:glycine cleavage system regulatory protein